MSIHVAITRRARPGREKEFEARMRTFLRASLAAGGVSGVHMLMPLLVRVFKPWLEKPQGGCL